MSPGPVPRGGKRASEVNKARERIIERVREVPGTSVNSMSTDLQLPYQLVRAICEELLEEHELERTVSGKKHRYYPAGYDRRTLNPDADRPLIGHGSAKRKEAPVFAPSPMSVLGQSQSDEGKDPRGPSIPPIRAWETIDPDIDTPSCGDTPSRPDVPSQPDTAPQPDTVTVRATVRRPDPIQSRPDTPTQPDPTPVAPTPRTDDDIDALAAQLARLKGMPRGTSMDAEFDRMISEIDDRIASSVSACPHCGAVPSVERTPKGNIINCACGLMVAMASGSSLTDLVRLYNRRAAP